MLKSEHWSHLLNVDCRLCYKNFSPEIFFYIKERWGGGVVKV